MISDHDLKRVIPLAEKMLQTDPSDAETRHMLAASHFLLALSLYHQGKKRDALREAEASCEIEETAQALSIIVASSYPFITEKSIQAARRAVILEPQSGQALNMLAGQLIQSHLLFFLRLSPRLFVHHIMNLGAIRREALEASSRAVELCPDDFPTRWTHLRALLWNGDVRGARKAYRVALSMERAAAHSGLERFRLKIQPWVISSFFFFWAVGLLIVQPVRALTGSAVRGARSLATSTKRWTGRR